jgi:hypothetical protein
LEKFGKTRRVGRAVTGTPRRPKKILLINRRRSARTLTGIGGPEDPRPLDFSIEETKCERPFGEVAAAQFPSR